MQRKHLYLPRADGAVINGFVVDSVAETVMGDANAGPATQPCGISYPNNGYEDAAAAQSLASNCD